MKPIYNLNKIKFATDTPTLQRAIDIYNKGSVTKFSEEPGSFSAIVLGSQPYRVSISAKKYDEGYCMCYLGQNDTLCKHLVALAICAVKNNTHLTDREKEINNEPVSSGQIGTLTKTQVVDFKKSVSTVIQKYIKAYEGPSRTWFHYQNRLEGGCNRLVALVSELPISEQTAELLIDMLLRLDEKLSRGGIDDSNGTVGGFIQKVVNVLGKYAKLDPHCIKAFYKLKDRETSFGWENTLLSINKKL